MEKAFVSKENNLKPNTRTNYIYGLIRPTSMSWRAATPHSCPLSETFVIGLLTEDIYQDTSETTHEVSFPNCPGELLYFIKW